MRSNLNLNSLSKNNNNIWKIILLFGIKRYKKNLEFFSLLKYYKQTQVLINRALLNWIMIYLFFTLNSKTKNLGRVIYLIFILYILWNDVF